MYDFTIYNYLKQFLNPCKLTTRKDETIIRCPYCGDSIHNKFDTHFYINNVPPFKFYCQKCNVAGVFNNSVMNGMLKLFDNKISDFLDSSYNNYKKSLNIKYGDSFNNYFNTKELIFKPKSIGKIEDNKIKYFNDRMGLILDEKDLERYRIILNIEDFLKKNEIDSSKFNKFTQGKIKELNKTSIMFLLYDKNMICCRNITNKGERYYNLTLFDSNIDGISKKFYSIENKLELNNSIFNINITEGNFDIIGVFNHIYNKEIHSNDLFLSANGKGYKFLLNYIMKLGILNANINIYSDKDVKLGYYEKFKDSLLLTKFNGMNIYYNRYKNEKDFGVSKDRIILDAPIKI